MFCVSMAEVHSSAVPLAHIQSIRNCINCGPQEEIHTLTHLYHKHIILNFRKKCWAIH